MLASSDLSRHAGKYYGKYSGTVTDNHDVDKRGVIMVTVPTIFGPTQSVQARPCLPYGHFFVPAPQTKVWVEFEAGDTRFPIWVGVWYPDGQTPTPAQKAPPDTRLIQTESGHQIEITDTPDEERILIKHKGHDDGNAFVTLDKDGNVIIANSAGAYLSLNAHDGNVMLMDQNQNVLTLTANGITLAHKDGKAFLSLESDSIRLAAEKIFLDGTSVLLGVGADTQVMLSSFLTTFMTHTHGSAVGPTTPPLVPLTVPSPLTAPFLSAAVQAK